MADVQIEEVVDYLSAEMKRALEGAVNEVIPDAIFDRDELFRAFKRNVYRACNIWERIPDRYVRP